MTSLRAKRLLLFGVSALLGVGLAAAVTLAEQGAGFWGRLVFIGRPFLQVILPEPDQVMPDGSVEVFVGFAPERGVAVETFRCWLNGREVTDALTLGQNGAHGKLFGLVEGANRLKIEVFGHSSWTDRYVQDVRVIPFKVVAHPIIDQA